MFSLCVAVLIREGVASTLFAVTLALTGIVAYDAIHVRMESGKHAAIFNELYQSGQVISPMLKDQYPLEISIGHTFWEVCGGAIFGIGMGLLLMLL